MALTNQIRTYLACWFQLNQGVILSNGDRLCPGSVLSHAGYSPEFEACWKIVMQNEGRDCYLEGTLQSIAELMTEEWDVLPCPRCTMPVPMPNRPVQQFECPCIDLRSWPNTTLPLPRKAIDSGRFLGHICDRVHQSSKKYAQEIDRAS